jgi:NAD(P)-dependent dehydrogenase (short-subunit alcohol dehydrogenase family)
MDKRNSGKVIITGGAQGIGSIIASELNIAGYEVIVLDMDMEAIREKLRENNAIKYIHTDVSNESEVLNALSQIQMGNLYALINNAAIEANMPITELTFEDWNRVLAVNLSAAFLLSKYTCSYLKETKGVIVNIASTRALMSEADTEAYSASKGGLIALTHSLAVSLAPNIRVNSISPGWIEVRDCKKKSKAQPVVQTEADKFQHPVGRVGIPEDVASLVKYLISHEAGFITGQNFIVDGGMTRKMIYV